MTAHNTSLYFDINDSQYPIVYHEKYNVKVGGLEKLHVFDAKKWHNIIEGLKEHGFDDVKFVEPLEASTEDLLVVHSKKYLKSLKWSYKVAMIAEVPLVACLPNPVVQRCYLRPMRYQVGGSILAGKLALERGWAINVGGGFHHCSGGKGGGFCPYADITLLIRFLTDRQMISTAMIVDLDAHQGNGHEHDFIDNKDVYILDMYNRDIYPRDKEAKKAISRRVELRSGVEDTEYLLKLNTHLRAALDEFQPDLVVYNAGTDILWSDPLGLMNITKEGIIKRDQFVFETCKQRHIPVVMLSSGGYLRETAKLIADSIANLRHANIIQRN